MNTPYNVLGVAPSADEAEIKKAYRKRARRIYELSGGVPGGKMKELDTAYDSIMAERSVRQINSAPELVSEYSDVRRLISDSRLSDAEEILDSVRSLSRGCEWNYLKALVLFRRGFLSEALLYARRALEKNPVDAECQALRDMIEGTSEPKGGKARVRTVLSKIIPRKRQRR